LDGFSPESLRQAMREKGLTQAEVARATGVSPSLVSRVLRGLRSPGSRFIASLKVVFPDRPMEYFFNLNDDPVIARSIGDGDVGGERQVETGCQSKSHPVENESVPELTGGTSKSVEGDAKTALADEIRSLCFLGLDHSERLLRLLEMTDIQDTTHDLFVPLYALASIGPEVFRFVAPNAIDFRGLVDAAKSWPREKSAMVHLAGSLAAEFKLEDLAETFSCLAETQFFGIAVCAMKMRWEF
jgi:hypothetical protein